VEPTQLAVRLLQTLNNDLPRLRKMDDYLHGLHADPYMPPTADAEYKLLAKRAVTNWMPNIVETPSQAMYVDGFRRGKSRPGEARVAGDAEEWQWWQRSGLDSKQGAIYRGALSYGHSFSLNERTDDGEVLIKGLSALRTAAIYDDPANDIDPVGALTVTKWPTGKKRGEARMWNELAEYRVTWENIEKPSVTFVKRHGASQCPVTRFVAVMDLEGRTTGVIEPMIPHQDRINQSHFDLLVLQTYQSFEVRTVSGLAPPMLMDKETGQPKLDDDGQPIAAPIDINARRLLMAEDPDVKFDSLPAASLEGLIASIEMSVRQFASRSQTPPHDMLGQIANLSAEALQAAQQSLMRKVASFQNSFGESWERTFRIAAEMAGENGGADDYSGEVIWRDMDGASMGVMADALGKMAESLEIPRKGLWPRIPGVTQNELDAWDDLAKEQTAVTTLATRRNAATVARTAASATQSRGNLTPASPATAA
jgi:hypothetical protein